MNFNSLITFSKYSFLLFVNLKDIVQIVQVLFTIVQDSLIRSGPGRLLVNIVWKPSSVYLGQPVDRHEVMEMLLLFPF